MLIAGGIGITPLLSILKSIAAAEAPREAWFLYGVRNRHDYIMRAQLKAISQVHPNVHLRVFYSRAAPAIDDLGVEPGHIDLPAL